jgi:hypothetical protein
MRKKKKEHKHIPLKEFYTEEQKNRERVEKIEQDIFEHLKEHTKKTLGKRIVQPIDVNRRLLRIRMFSSFS